MNAPRATRSYPTAPNAGEVFRALSDATRRRLLQLIVAEEVNVTELIEILRLPQSTISRHLKVLRDADLVQDRRVGATVWYRAKAGADEAELPGVVLNWLKARPLAKPVRNRLDRVLRNRRDGTVGFFDRLGHQWDEMRRSAFGDGFAFEALTSLLPRDWRVADIGTGTGFLLPALAAQFREVVAVEPSQPMLDCARRRVERHALRNVTFHHGDLGRLPIGDRSCDLTIACLVLHHVEQPGAALAEMLRVVRPGGAALIVEQEAHENQAFYEMMQDRWWGFGPDELVGQLRSAGFADVRHRPLRQAEPRTGAIEAPGLFVVTGRRGDD